MARSGRSWVVAAVMLGGALAACGGQSSDPTVLPPVLSTTRPSGFGGTLPVETTSTLAPTIAPTIAPTVDAAVTTVAVSTTDEAALRARVLEYDRAFREELLHMPNPNYDRLRSYFTPHQRSGVSFDAMRTASETQRTFRLNSPDIYKPAVEALKLVDAVKGVVTLCVVDNLVAVGPGPDGIGLTNDDVVLDNTVGGDRRVDEWLLVGDAWFIEQIVHSAPLAEGESCVG